MKIRKDFVTNSSSSSFIISRDTVSRERLLEILLEIANTEASYYDEESYTLDDVKEDCVAYRYNIIEATRECPYEVDNNTFYEDTTTYDNHFIIDNDDCGRYNWQVIEKVLNKYNIPWNYGYCD